MERLIGTWRVEVPDDIDPFDPWHPGWERVQVFDSNGFSVEPWDAYDGVEQGDNLVDALMAWVEDQTDPEPDNDWCEACHNSGEGLVPGTTCPVCRGGWR